MSVSNRLLKYASHGALTYGSLYYLSGGASSIVIAGTEIPLVVAGLALASSLTNDFVHSWVFTDDINRC